MKKIIWSILLLATVISCTNDYELLNIANESNVGRDVTIHFSIKPFVNESETRANFGEAGSDDSPVYFNFEDGDAFGIYCFEDNSYARLDVCDDFTPQSIDNSCFSFSAIVPNNFISSNKNYIIFYPYKQSCLLSNGGLFTYDGYGNQYKDSVAYKSAYYFSNIFGFNGTIPNTNISLASKSAAIQLQVSGLWGTVKSIELVNVDALGKFYVNIPCAFTQNGVQSDTVNSHKVPQLNLSLGNKYSYYSDVNKYVITSFPTVTGDFVLRATFSNYSVMYSYGVYGSKTLTEGHWANVICSYWTSTPPTFAYEYLDINTGIYH
jgi:hypothetical protein